MSTFDTISAFTLKAEGGYSNDPEDPGGETNYGISKRDHPNTDIKNLTIPQALQIYHDEYWVRMSGDLLPPLTACALFDFGFASGVSTGVEHLQNLAGVAPDGQLGPRSIAAIKGRDDHSLALALCKARVNYDISLGKARYEMGWVDRVVDLIGLLWTMSAPPAKQA